MGLMYLFPTEENESEQIIIQPKDKTVILRSYGLPWIFWGYLSAVLVVMFAMYLAIRDPLIKLKMSEDLINVRLAYLVEWTLYITPIILLGFFLYEKVILKKETELKITHKVFFIPVYSYSIKINSNHDLVIEHFLESPNVAKMQNRPELRGFENKGYFELRAIVGNEKKLIDRHSRKQDLVKIKEILSMV